VRLKREHQQLQRQISEQTKKAQLYAGFDMNATFDRLFNQSNASCIAHIFGVDVDVFAFEV
jgi:hypothetical protein